MRSVIDNGFVARQQAEILRTGLSDQHAVEWIAVKPREGQQSPAVFRVNREQIKAIRDSQQTFIAAGAAEGDQNRDFPEGGCADKSKPGGVERLTLFGAELFWCDPDP